MREKKLIKLIKSALKNDHLYSNHEIAYMKKELAQLNQKVQNHKQTISKGFGNS